MKTVQISDEDFRDMVEEILHEESLEASKRDSDPFVKWIKVKLPKGKVELKLCPFCGAKPSEHEQTNEGMMFLSVWCENCDALGPHSEHRKRARVLWNQRA